VGGIVAFETDALRDHSLDIGHAGLLDVVAPWPMADLALDVPKRLFRRPHSIAMTRAISHNVAGDASRLEVSMPIQEGLERRGVLRARHCEYSSS